MNVKNLKYISNIMMRFKNINDNENEYKNKNGSKYYKILMEMCVKIKNKI